MQSYYQRNKERLKEKQKQYYAAHKERISEYHKECYNINKDAFKIKNQIQYQKHKEDRKCASKEYYNNNVSVISEKAKRYRRKKPDLIKDLSRRYYIKNRDIIKQKTKSYKIDRLNCDVGYRIASNLRSRIYQAIKKDSGIKAYKSIELLGCTIEDCRNYLESQFTEGMTWDNYGEWHIDHIRPCASYDLTDPEQQKECFNYKNLQPLWAEDNLTKGSRFS